MRKPSKLNITANEIHDIGGSVVNAAYGTNIDATHNKIYRVSKDAFVIRDDEFLQLYDAIEDMRNTINEFNLDDKNEKELLTNLSILEESIKSENPEVSKIEKAYSSVQRILEMVTASAIHENSPSITTVISTFKTAMAAIGWSLD